MVDHQTAHGTPPSLIIPTPVQYRTNHRSQKLMKRRENIDGNPDASTFSKCFGLRFWVRTLVYAATMDLHDANYAWSHEKINCLYVYQNQLMWKPGIFRRILTYVLFLMRAAKFSFICKRKPVKKRRINLLAWTFNQSVAMEPVYKALLNANLIYEPDYKSNSSGISFLLASLLGLPFGFRMVALYCKSSDYQKRALKYCMHEYWLSMGYFLSSHSWLYANRPKLVVVSNDHAMYPRMAALAARQQHVPVAYIQHASVTEMWPPLSFDYALLEGLDALHKYMKTGRTDTLVFLVGSPKMDTLSRNYNKSQKISTLMMCISNNDVLDRVEELLRAIRNEFSQMNLILRPHPADTPRWEKWEAITASNHAVISDSRTMAINESLAKADAVIAGDSSVLLEAALANVYPVYYDFNETCQDFYGYVKNGLVDAFSCASSLNTHLQSVENSKPYVRHRAKYYCHTINTPFDGRSAGLAASLLNQLSEECDPEEKGWARMPIQEITAFEPGIQGSS